MSKPKCYLEPTIPSYLTARPSRDVLVAAHQQITREWWRTAPVRFELYVSQIALDEISSGDPDAAKRRIATVSGIEKLQMNKEVRSLIPIYERALGIPTKARTDIIHVAFSVVFELNYLVTWNCAHLANGQVMSRLLEINNQIGLFTPLIVTPEGLEEEEDLV